MWITFPEVFFSWHGCRIWVKARSVTDHLRIELFFLGNGAIRFLWMWIMRSLSLIPRAHKRSKKKAVTEFAVSSPLGYYYAKVNVHCSDGLKRQGALIVYARKAEKQAKAVRSRRQPGSFLEYLFITCFQTAVDPSECDCVVLDALEEQRPKSFWL